jgi:hypothetical protein
VGTKLIDESPILVLPSLAETIGLNEAIVLQQIHFWLKTYEKANNQSKFRDGRWWVYNTYEEWQENFPWWSIRTIQRIISSLEEKKLLISEQFEASDWNQRKWYTIDMLECDKLSSSIVTSCHPLNKNTETTTENIKENDTEQEFDEFEQLLGEEVLERTRKLRSRDSLHRKGSEEAMFDGLVNESDIKTQIEKLFRISPVWTRKDWKSLVQFVKEKPPNESLERWARWWYQNDWRGKEQQPPTAAQIQELWPQAFAKSGQQSFRMNEDGSFYV